MTSTATALASEDLPLLLASDPALAANAHAMAAYCRASGVHLAPHAKTHMERSLVELQTREGAWGFTAATPRQVRTLAAWGVRRILHANLAVDPAFISWLGAGLDADAPDYLCYVDSIEAVALLERHLGAPGRPLPVLIERGFPGGRTGTRSLDDARAVAEAVRASPVLHAAGVAGFEGLAPREADEPAPRVPRRVDGLLADIHETVTALRADGLLPPRPIVTAGGSSYFDRVVAILGPDAWDEPVETVLRSGCYLTHDHGMYRDSTPRAREASGPRFDAALSLAARVLSTPEPGLALVGFGRRDVPTDERMPIALGEDGEPRPGWRVAAVNDHHAFLRLPADEAPAVGDVLRFGISHPCGAFDRHRRILRIDAAGAIADDLRPQF